MVTRNSGRRIALPKLTRNRTCPGAQVTRIQIPGSTLINTILIRQLWVRGCQIRADLATMGDVRAPATDQSAHDSTEINELEIIWHSSFPSFSVRRPHDAPHTPHLQRGVKGGPTDRVRGNRGCQMGRGPGTHINPARMGQGPPHGPPLETHWYVCPSPVFLPLHCLPFPPQDGSQPCQRRSSRQSWTLC